MRLYERRGSLSSSLNGPNLVQKGLLLLWFFTIMWCEIGMFYLGLKSCRWPGGSVLPFNQASHVLIISDAQVENPAIAPSWMSSFFTSLQQLVFRLYLEKTWRAAMRLKPDHVIFLGDMTASGRQVVSDEEYEVYYQSFNKTFPLPDSSLSVHYLPGNNDIGLNMESTKSRIARRRYLKHFGPFNQVISVQNHTLVLLDAPGLAEEDNMRTQNIEQYEPVKDGPMDFVKSMEPGTSAQPTILFTHIPLARPDTASCGPWREKGTIRRGAGTGYQNMIGKKASAYILEHIKPSVVFSGDDRDYCEYVHHVTSTDPVREVTVKSFSMARDIRRPGFQLLFLVSPTLSLASTLSASYFDKPCFLPDQQKIHKSIYLPLALISFIALVLINLRQPRRQRMTLLDRETSFFSSMSAVGSPAVLTMSPQLSPLGLMYDGFRTPVANSASKSYAATPVRRLSSRSLSPLPTPLPSSPSPNLFSQGEDNDDLYPVQYVTLREESVNRFLNGHYEYEEPRKPQSAISVYFPSPNSEDLVPSMYDGSRLPWSWSFVLSGRRRRLTIPRPSRQLLYTCINALWTFIRDLVKGRRVGSDNIARDVIMDCVVVFFSALVLWVMIAYWLLR